MLDQLQVAYKWLCALFSKKTIHFSLVFWVLSWRTSLLCIVGELTGGRSLDVAVYLGDMWHMTGDRWYVTGDRWQMTHDIWQVTGATSVILGIYIFFSYVATICRRWEIKCLHDAEFNKISNLEYECIPINLRRYNGSGTVSWVFGGWVLRIWMLIWGVLT